MDAQHIFVQRVVTYAIIAPDMARIFEKPNRTSQSSSPTPQRRVGLLPALLVGGLYTLFILALALFGASRLYQWSRTLALNADPLPNLNQITIDTSANAGENDAETNDNAVPAKDGSQASRSDSSAQLAAPPERLNILLLGTDERQDENGPPRTDTMMLVTLDLAHQTAGMLSLPRDLWVPIPGYDVTTKINTAYVIGENRGYPGGGPQLAKDTVSSFIGRPIQYYVRVNFNGFVRFVDLIGGIDINVPQTIHDEKYPTADYGYEVFHIDAGQQHMDGATALKYVRTRHGDNDYKRATRQQQVIQAVMDKVMKADMIPTLLAKAPQLTATMRDSFSTDMPLPLAMDLANDLRQHSLREVRQLVLDSHYGEETYSDEGAWILLPDRSQVRPALAQFFSVPQTAMAEDEVPANIVVSALAAQAVDPSPENAEKISDASAARLEILNGTGYPGVAARIRDMLQKEGWHVVAIGDADRNDYRRTLIVNYNAADTVVNQIGTDLELQPNLPTLNGLIISDTVDLRIIVGQDYLKDVLGITN